MYHLLIKDATGKEIQHDEVHALDARLCRELAAKRDIPGAIEAPVAFRVNEKDLQIDYLSIQNVAMGKLCSERFIEVLRAAHVPFVHYPTSLFDKDMNQLLTDSYFFWIPQWVEGVIDWEHSEEWIDLEAGSRRLTKLVLTANCETTAPLLFHIREKGYDLIHEHLRLQFEASGITGIAFAPLDAVSMPYEGLKKMELERLLQQNPADWTLWYQLSKVQILLHHDRDALASVNRVLALKTDSEEAWYRRGEILSRLGDLEEALNALQKAIEINPRSQAWNQYSAVLRQLGRNEEALSAAEYSTKIWDKSPLSWYELGSVHAASGHYEEVLKALDRCLSLGGGNSPISLSKIYSMQGEALFALGRYEEGLARYEIGLAAKPLDIALYRGKARILRAMGHVKEATVVEQEVERLEQQREKSLKR
jgi:tetratricopeptide (TPR) repeat protein